MSALRGFVILSKPKNISENPSLKTVYFQEKRKLKYDLLFLKTFFSPRSKKTNEQKKEPGPAQTCATTHLFCLSGKT